MKNDDYLWDKTGPPDADVEGLEQVLGALRHRMGRPAWLEEFTAEEQTPAASNVIPFAPRRRWWQPIASTQALAAAVALCFVAGGLWLGLTRNTTPERAVAVTGLAASAVELPATPVNREVSEAPQVVARPPRHAEKPVRVVAVRATKPPKVATPRLVAAKAVAPPTSAQEPEITPAEGRKALADLAIAMRVLHDTFNLAQRNAESRVILLPVTTR